MTIKATKQKLNAKYKQERRDIINEVIGNKCLICGGIYYLTAHEIYGNKHLSFWNCTKEELKTMVNSGNFVRVCYTCHKHIHWMMKYLKMRWQEINEKVNH